MKRMISYIWLLIVIIFIIFLYGFTSTRNKDRNVQKVEVIFEEGKSHFLTHKLVNKLLIQNIDSVKKQSKSSVDLHRLEKVVLSNPYVEKANVYLTLDGVLNTQIKQKKPIARIILSGKNCYVDKHGGIMPLSTHFSARVPLVTGLKTTTDLRDLIKLIHFINQDEFLKKEIISVIKNDRDEYQFNVRSGNYKIDFGKIEKIDEKFKKMKAFYNAELLNSSIKNYKKITLKYDNQVVCTKIKQNEKL